MRAGVMDYFFMTTLLPHKMCSYQSLAYLHENYYVKVEGVTRIKNYCKNIGLYFMSFFLAMINKRKN